VTLSDRSKVKASSKPWMTSSELSDFKKMRAEGAMTVFRSAHCQICEKEIHNSKQFCSKDCYEKSENGGSKT